MAKRKIPSVPKKRKKKRTGEQISKDEEDAADDSKARKRLAGKRVSNDFVERVLVLRGRDVSKVGYRERWALLLSLGLIDEGRFRLAIYRRPTAVRCRLDSIASPEFVSLCKRVIAASSKAARRASLLANLVLLKAYDEGVLDAEVPVLMCSQGCHQKHVNSLFRRCAEVPHAYHVAVEEQYAEVLPPVQDEALLRNHVQGALRQRFVAALKAHWRTHFSARVQRYLESTVTRDKRFSRRHEKIGSTTYKIAWWGDVKLGKWYVVRKKLMDAEEIWPQSLRELIMLAKRDVHLTTSLESFRNRMDSGDEEDEEDGDDEGGQQGRVPWVDLVRCHIAMARAFEEREERSFSAAPVFRRGASYMSINEHILKEGDFKRIPFDLAGCVSRLREKRKQRSSAYRKKR